VLSAEAFKVFVSALAGTDPVLTTENLNDLHLLSEEFGFAALRSKVWAFDRRNTAPSKPDESKKSFPIVPEPPVEPKTPKGLFVSKAKKRKVPERHGEVSERVVNVSGRSEAPEADVEWDYFIPDGKVPRQRAREGPR
jgi:hypothetical protein